MAAEDEVTTGEIARNLRDMRTDTQVQNNAMRNDMQLAIGKLEAGIHEVRVQIAEAPYVHNGIFEEVRKSQGERIGEIEKDVIEIRSTLARVNQVLWGAVISIFCSVVGGIVLAILLAGVK